MTQSRGLASLRICNNSFLAIAAALQPHTPHMYLCNISMTGGAQGLTNVSCNVRTRPRLDEMSTFIECPRQEGSRLVAEQS